ncbi:velvet factor-domain-containing protein [Coprinopsis sp. MPI-PUGE-AT-0042]|nr:velvet factor-domain-containing protein [Coprinopsis sp. MPI-PUGE-AT-0042]
MNEAGGHSSTFHARYRQDRHLPPPHPDFQPVSLRVHTTRQPSPSPPLCDRQDLQYTGEHPRRNSLRQPIIYFESEQFAGQTMRAELVEIQKADLGRKYARVDRRPLDPPPVIMLRLFEVSDVGTDRQREKEVSNYEEVDMLGLVGTVDLFQVSGPRPDSERDSPGNTRESSTSPGPSTSSRPNAPTSHSFQEGSSDLIHYVDDEPITESSKCTNFLVGSTFIQPHLVEYQGKKVLLFVFADLAVKTEGVFVLRYRAFDLYGTQKEGMDPSDRTMQAECFGGPFRVYSTKDFPGLQASTDLTKHLARWGVRLNIREVERKRRKKGVAEPSLYTTEVLTVKRKRNATNSQDASDSDD